MSSGGGDNNNSSSSQAPPSGPPMAPPPMGQYNAPGNPANGGPQGMPPWMNPNTGYGSMNGPIDVNGMYGSRQGMQGQMFAPGQQGISPQPYGGPTQRTGNPSFQGGPTMGQSPGVPSASTTPIPQYGPPQFGGPAAIGMQGQNPNISAMQDAERARGQFVGSGPHQMGFPSFLGGPQQRASGPPSFQGGPQQQPLPPFFQGGPQQQQPQMGSSQPLTASNNMGIWSPQQQQPWSSPQQPGNPQGNPQQMWSQLPQNIQQMLLPLLGGGGGSGGNINGPPSPYR